MPDSPHTADIVERLATACERHAWHHFTAAAENITETAVDLWNVDRGLECLARATTLRAALKDHRKAQS